MRKWLWRQVDNLAFRMWWELYTKPKSEIYRWTYRRVIGLEKWLRPVQ
jgi:hypothetical protein